MKYQAKNMFLGVAFFSAMLAGCASTDTDSSGQEGADKVSTYTESSDSMNDSYNSQDMANLETVFYFEFDQATLTVKARKALDAQIVRLKKTTGPVRLEGHADER
ncbi:MAG: peptidoglycan-binding protein, partial [Gammaproteobacteria bacterium]|nr:peptidoglycan-binding protein [Gammaproteobacteria bacterium]MBU1831056.1 peptidoglycan-binding protein [Gammaproteobacteria bacterium]